MPTKHLKIMQKEEGKNLILHSRNLKTFQSKLIISQEKEEKKNPTMWTEFWRLVGIQKKTYKY